MKFVLFKYQGSVSYGLLKNEEIHAIEGQITEEYDLIDQHYQLSEVELLAPCKPSKIVCVGINYKDNAKQNRKKKENKKVGVKIPDEPLTFLKPETAVVGPNQDITYPQMANEVHFEPELAVVIKDTVRNIKESEVDQHILGYTCFNDLTAIDLIAKDGMFTRGKSFDGFAPLGPTIVTDIDPSSLKIQSFINGKLKQDSNTSQMIFKIPEIISFISKIMTLRAGDVVTTGTPGVTKINPGDQLEIKIEEIGSLKNKIIEE
ncbi:fumarylacetoacetate hydrolase family protein [Natroniella sulfidigena]|uniref:fumarylacetoacetate hydrolase family protein n=1 Tax=Natroniella sulfidigena TaxID=723921 RepID=UPI00200B6ABD|nr:fumarylacetoacetate hydrolase family protein [Natroniella sulfidigena]MCK8817256.1 fumarylacetoacetate hydrolase family protein [Natroniella sulfidigena]